MGSGSGSCRQLVGRFSASGERRGLVDQVGGARPRCGITAAPEPLAVMDAVDAVAGPVIAGEIPTVCGGIA